MRTAATVRTAPRATTVARGRVSTQPAAAATHADGPRSRVMGSREPLVAIPAVLLHLAAHANAAMCAVSELDDAWPERESCRRCGGAADEILVAVVWGTG